MLIEEDVAAEVAAAAVVAASVTIVEKRDTCHAAVQIPER